MLRPPAKALIGVRTPCRNCRRIGRQRYPGTGNRLLGTHACRAPMSQQKRRRVVWTFPQMVDPAPQRLAFKLLGKSLADGGRVRVGKADWLFGTSRFASSTERLND